MIAIPAVDLRAGACVQLVGGSYEHQRVRLDEPVAVAHRWSEVGFQRVHVVDLDAATGRGDNGTIVERIVSDTPAELQVGGGVRTTERLEQILRWGARYAVVGTRGIEDRCWLEEIASRNPGRIIVAADVRERSVVTRGWDRTLPITITTLVSTLSTVPLAGILITAVHVEGTMTGPDLPLVDAVVRCSDHPIVASGGIGSMDHLRELDARGVSGVVIGMALYTGTLDPRTVAEEYGR